MSSGNKTTIISYILSTKKNNLKKEQKKKTIMRFQSQKKKSLKTHQLDFQEFDTPVLCLFHCLEGMFAYLHKELHVNSEATISEQHISVYEFFKKKRKKEKHQCCNYTPSWFEAFFSSAMTA